MTKPDLNRLSAVEIMGWKLYTPDFDDFLDHSSWIDPSKPNEYLPRKLWNPLTDMNQIMQVVEKMRKSGWYLNLVGQFDDKWFCSFMAKTGQQFPVIGRTTINEAILTAALRAKGVGKP